ncbi:hypothetical protein L4C34_05845 [Vibrio profundum]|uniref:outer membrane protein OmpK n=1 Tax=Vibrio profundum TaxID=2910247 RepID=UPI003D0F0F76
MKNLNILLSALLVICLPSKAYSKYLFGWANISINYLDWSKGTRDRVSFQENYLFPQVEGGANFDWGELYGFYQVQKINRSSETWATSYKPKLYYKLGLGELRFYAQQFAKDQPNISTSNTVGGLAYRLGEEKWFLYPWIGPLHTTLNRFGNNYTGFNGYVAGLTGTYTFSAYQQKFRLAAWHETEFLRKQEYLAVANEEDKGSLNGAMGLWWLTTEKFSLGIKYRYSYNKLGFVGNQNAIVYSIRYAF